MGMGLVGFAFENEKQNRKNIIVDGVSDDLTFRRYTISLN